MSEVLKTSTDAMQIIEEGERRGERGRRERGGGRRERGEEGDAMQIIDQGSCWRNTCGDELFKRKGGGLFSCQQQQQKPISFLPKSK